MTVRYVTWAHAQKACRTVLGQDSLLSITGLWENVAKQRVLTRMALPYWSVVLVGARHQMHA